jgi:hypothetical protein
MTPSWRATGPYVEACNCEAICPCRMVGGRDGRRATYQLCQWAIAWTIEEGHFGVLNLSGLRTVMAGYWDEDERGSPWRVVLYVDERADASQRSALADIFLGRAGGTPAHNYAPAIKEVMGIVPAPLEIVHKRGAERLRAGDAIEVRARSVFPSEEAVTCGVPGHDRGGEELVHDLLRVKDEWLDFEFHGRCGFATTFDYSG